MGGGALCMCACLCPVGVHDLFSVITFCLDSRDRLECKAINVRKQYYCRKLYHVLFVMYPFYYD